MALESSNQPTDLSWGFCRLTKVVGKDSEPLGVFGEPKVLPEICVGQNLTFD